MEETKRKYVKKSNEGKISVKYYLNTDLKPKISDSGEELFPLYFKVTVKQQATKIRSLTDCDLMTKTEFNLIEKAINSTTLENLDKNIFNLMNKESNDIYGLFDSRTDALMPILSEKYLIFDIVNYLNPFNSASFDIKSIVEEFQFYNMKVYDLINKFLKQSMKQILENEDTQNINAKIYLRIIDWENSNSYDLMYIMQQVSPNFISLFEKKNRSFQIIAKRNYNNLAIDENNALLEISDEKLKDLILGLKYQKKHYEKECYKHILEEINFLIKGN